MLPWVWDTCSVKMADGAVHVVSIFCVLVLSVTDKQLLKSSATIVNIFLILPFFFGFVYLLIFFQWSYSNPHLSMCKATFCALSLHCQLVYTFKFRILTSWWINPWDSLLFFLTEYKGVCLCMWYVFSHQYTSIYLNYK